MVKFLKQIGERKPASLVEVMKGGEESKGGDNTCMGVKDMDGIESVA